MKRDIVEKLEFGCPFKPGTIGEKDAELAEAIMQEAANEIKRLRLALSNYDSAWDAVICEDHQNAPDFHNQHQELDGGCLFCTANRYRTALKLIAEPDVTPEMAKRSYDGVSMDRIYEDIAHEALLVESV